MEYVVLFQQTELGWQCIPSQGHQWATLQHFYTAYFLHKQPPTIHAAYLIVVNNTVWTVERKLHVNTMGFFV